MTELCNWRFCHIKSFAALWLTWQFLHHILKKHLPLITVFSALHAQTICAICLAVCKWWFFFMIRFWFVLNCLSENDVNYHYKYNWWEIFNILCALSEDPEQATDCTDSAVCSWNKLLFLLVEYVISSRWIVPQKVECACMRKEWNFEPRYCIGPWPVRYIWIGAIINIDILEKLLKIQSKFIFFKNNILVLFPIFLIYKIKSNKNKINLIYKSIEYETALLGG